MGVSITSFLIAVFRFFAILEGMETQLLRTSAKPELEIVAFTGLPTRQRYSEEQRPLEALVSFVSSPNKWRDWDGPAS